jgi:5-methylcytosine-specific restriction endonuclease McrA
MFYKIKILNFFGLKTNSDYDLIITELEELKTELSVIDEMKTVLAELEESNKNYITFIDELSQEKFSIKKLKNFSDRVREIGKCDICGETKDLTAHHIWSKIMYPSLAYRVENGVCLCSKCHNAFHKKYKQPIQINPNSYAIFKVLLQNDITLYGKINYANY